MEKLIYAALISFAVTIGLGLITIPVLKKMKFGQNIRDDGPQSHLKKAGTPTMGDCSLSRPSSWRCLVWRRGAWIFPWCAS